MSLSIAPVASRPTAPLTPAPKPGAQDVKNLALALNNNDLAGARSAYAALVKQAPEGSTLQPGSPFAQLGKALVSGDIDSAKTAFADLVKSRRPTSTGERPDSPVSLPPPLPAASSTGGVAGAGLYAVA